MALKDLVADTSKITESMIEEIVGNYVRYDPTTYEVVLTPAGVALGNDAKVLVILVAILGWQYVVEEPHPVDTRPAALERLTGIHGGTLRPILKKLKDSHLISVKDGHYSARIANLDAIARTLAGERTAAPATRSASRRAKVSQRGLKSDEAPEAARRERASRKSGMPIRPSLNRLVDEGFFSEVRTLNQVVARLRELAIIAKRTSVSGPIADLVRSGRLARKKVTQGSKEVWGYKAE